MTSYGFKLLLTNLYIGQGQKPQDFGGTGYLDLLVADVEAAMERRAAALSVADDQAPKPLEESTSEGEDANPETDEEQAIPTEAQVEPSQPSSPADLSASEDIVDSQDDDAADTGDDVGVAKPKHASVVRLEKVQRLKSGVLLHTQYGLVGDHHLAVDPDAKKIDTDLRELATTRLYRAVLIAPPAGLNAFLAVEVISRSHAAAQLPRRLHQGAQGHRLKLRPKGPVVDKPSLDDLLENGGVQEVELYKTSFAADSSHPDDPEQVTVKIKVGTSSSKSSDLINRIKGWPLFNRNNEADGEGEAPKTKIRASEEADALAGILWAEIADVGWDDTKEIGRAHV